MVAGRDFVLWMKFEHAFVGKESSFLGDGLSPKGVVAFLAQDKCLSCVAM